MSAAPVRIVLAGAAGRMGRMCREALANRSEFQLVAALVRGDDPARWLSASRADVLLDFTLVHVSRDLAPAAAAAGVRPVVGTSGWTDADVALLSDACRAAGLGGLLVPNFSIGAVLQMRHAKELARHLPCAGIREIHHPGKKDSPSGTARATARAVGQACGSEPTIASERRDGVVAVQEVRFEAPGEEVVLRHEVSDRRAYLPGILLALHGVGALQRLHVGLDVLLCGRADDAPVRL